MVKYPENTTVWVSRVVNGFREVSVVDEPRSLWTKSEYGSKPSRHKVLEKLPSDLSKAEVINKLKSRGIADIRFKRQCKNLENIYTGTY